MLQLSFPVKAWSVRACDVRVVSRLLTFGLPALSFYEAYPHPNVDMREQFADLFTVLQVCSLSAMAADCRHANAAARGQGVLLSHAWTGEAPLPALTRSQPALAAGWA